MTEPWTLSAASLARAYRSGACTPAEAIESCLDRIEAMDGTVEAFTLVLREEALAEARKRTDELRAGADRGPLHGIPVAVKDLFAVEGTITTAGSDVPVGGVRRPADRDALAVARLRGAGAIVLGRTRTHEYAWGITTRRADGTGAANPWDPDRITGGSSGGSAAAVAAGCVPVALGTDTGGSVRIPAAFCGTVGWKPAYGSLSLDGVVPLAPSLDHTGVLARTVEDTALVHAVIAGAATAAWAPPAVSAMRLGTLHDPTLPPLEPAVRSAIDALVAALAAGGAAWSRVELAAGAGAMEAFGPIQMREALHVHTEVLGTWPGWATAYGPDVAGRLRRAEGVSVEAASAASAAREELRRRLAGSLETVDALLCPVVPCPPPPVSEPDHVELGGGRVPLRDAVMPFTVAANLAGFPAVAVPIGLDDIGLPLSVQVTGREESVVRGIAGAVQEVAGVPSHPPSRS